MDCTTVRQNIDELQADRLNPDTVQAMRQHLYECSTCRAFERDVKLIRQQLTRIEVPQIPDELANKLFASLRSRSRPILAVAASVILAVSALAALLINQRTAIEQPEIAANAHITMVHTVRLAVNSPRPIGSVRFRIELPDHVEIQGHPGNRILEWTDALAAGRNRLDIPVRITGEPKGALVARLDYAGGSRELPISLASAGNMKHMQ